MAEKGVEQRAPDPWSLSVLIHGMNFSPEPIGIGRYTGELAKYLSSRGLRVEVITAPPHYPGWKLRAPYRSNRYSVEKGHGVIVRRCPLILNQSGRGLWRLIAPLSFAIAAAPVVFWRIISSRPNCVLCIEPTIFSLPAALVGAALVGSKRVLHVQDLEVDAAFSVGHLKSGWLKKVASFFERSVMRRFDLVVTISDRMAQSIIAGGVSPERVRVVRNWVDLSKITYVNGTNEYRRLFRIEDRDFVVLYSGQMGPKQSLDILIDAAARCQDNRRVKFILAGEGPSKQHLIDRARKLQNVYFLPLQGEDKLCELLNVADLHVITQDKATADLVLPSKLAGMLASGRSILVTAAKGTELASLLEDAAHVVPPGDPEALAAAIERLDSSREPLPRPYGDLVSRFSADNQLPIFYDLICALSEPAAGVTGTQPAM